MLGLHLRDEFLGQQMPGTAIALRAHDNTGAAQQSAEHILSITYPTADVLIALRAVSAQNTGRPVVLIGERGRGKSHIMAVMHHALASPEIVEAWLKSWGTEISGGVPPLRRGYLPISEPVHNQEYPLLWNLLFERHPRGPYYKGLFSGLKQPFPPRSLLEDMFADQPVCLILDEFQTWYATLPDRDQATGLPLKQSAFNFVQILAELAKDRPEILIFVISVRDNQNEMFRQLHRQTPVLVDFQGPSAREDRRKLVLHRLFANRRNIPEADIAALCAAHAGERFRLLHPDRPEADRARIQGEVFACWPYSPELLDLLDDHILMAAAAQETRDLIRILAQVFKSRGEQSPVITPADFFVDGESDEVQTLVDAIATQSRQEKLREIARRNLAEARDAGVNIPHARELVSAIWMRSMSPARNVGGTSTVLQLDITRQKPLDDNAFQAELALLVENSVNIQGDEVSGGPLRFGLEENPRSKARAFARNNKLWQGQAEENGHRVGYPGQDLLHIRNTLKKLFVPESDSPPCRVIVLGPRWRDDPWSEVEEHDQPKQWTAPALLVIPEPVADDRAGVHAVLGEWLVRHVAKRRNTVRFLLMPEGAAGLFADEDLLFAARCSFLCSPAGWGGTDRTYAALRREFDRPLWNRLKETFTAFAVLRVWDFQHPERCEFDIEGIRAQDTSLPREVEEVVFKDLFDPTAFVRLVLEHAKEGHTVGSLLDDLAEPPPPGAGDAIPWLGETKLYEHVLALAAKGDIVLNVDGAWVARRAEDASDNAALTHIRSKAFRSGQEMRRVQLALPGAVGGDTVVTPLPVPQPGKPGPETGDSATTTDTPTRPTPTNGATHKSEDKTTAVGTAEPKPVKKRKTEMPTGGINLSGCFETWDLGPTQRIDTAAITFAGLTVRQIKTILQGIPSAYKATLEITWQEDEQP